MDLGGVIAVKMKSIPVINGFQSIDGGWRNRREWEYRSRCYSAVSSPAVWHLSTECNEQMVSIVIYLFSPPVVIDGAVVSLQRVHRRRPSKSNHGFTKKIFFTTMKGLSGTALDGECDVPIHKTTGRWGTPDVYRWRCTAIIMLIALITLIMIIIGARRRVC